MNNQLDYLAAKAHIDGLICAAERARMARDATPRTPSVAGRGMVGRLRGLIGGRPEMTRPEVHAECP